MAGYAHRVYSLNTLAFCKRSSIQLLQALNYLRLTLSAMKMEADDYSAKKQKSVLENGATMRRYYARNNSAEYR